MKLFNAFRLDTANHLLWRNDERVSITPKAFDVLAHLVENAGQVVTQDKILEALWPETYVNPEVLRKYILEIRKALGDRTGKPEFIETLPKRGYRFVASVVDEHIADPPALISQPTPARESTPENTEPQTVYSKNETHGKHIVRGLALVALFGLVLATGMGGYFRPELNRASSPSLANTSIAVLPFADMSLGKDQEYFSDGLSEQLIQDLAKVPGLKVVGRSSAFQFKGKNEDLREVGRKLGVANVLEGSVQREGNRMRITAELIKVDDGFQLWSQTYDRRVNDIFAVQDEIARAATAALQLKLLGSNGQPIPSTFPSANPEAYESYLQGRYFMGRGTGKEDLGKALAYTDTAINLDRTYAPAWALRASVQNRMAEIGLADVTEGFRKARNDAERAIALDPNSASGYLALARTQIFYDWDWDAANTCLAKAAVLEPSNAEIFRLRSYVSRDVGDLEQAIKLQEQAVALDPLRPDLRLGLGYVLYVAGRYDKARAELQKALDLNPQAARVHFFLSKILIAQGKLQQALVEIDKEPGDWGKLTGQVLIYHALSREQDSNAALAGLIATHQNDSAYQIAQVYAFRGEFDKSFEWLDRAYKQRDPGLIQIKTDPLLKTVRHDQRFAVLFAKMRPPK